MGMTRVARFILDVCCDFRANGHIASALIPIVARWQHALIQDTLLINTLLNRSQALLNSVTQSLARHPKRASAVIAALLLGGGGGAIVGGVRGGAGVGS